MEVKTAVLTLLFALPAAAEVPRSAPLRLPTADKERMISERISRTSAKRTEAIRLLEELIAMKPGPETAADALFKLAELYWEDARQTYAEAMREFEQRTEHCKTTPSADCARPQPKLNVTRSETIYAQIVEKYPNFKQLDVALYLLGFGAQQAGRGDEAVKWLTRLIEEQPRSELLPDAWMMLGEHWFGSDFAKARAAYAKVLEHKGSSVYDLALFKSAWCDWKLGDTRRAAERFKEVLDLATVAEKSGSGEQQRRSVALREEALQYLTLLFTEDESITAKDAYEFLASIGGERYSREVLGRLAEAFAGQGRHDRALQAWRHLIALDPKHSDAPKHQLRVIDSFVAMDADDDAIAAAKTLAVDYGPGSVWAEANRDRGARMEIEAALTSLAKRLHGEAQADEGRRKKPDLKAYRRIADLYAFTLARFPESPRAVELRFLRAEVLYFKLEALEEAGDEYLVVGQTPPIGARQKDALLKAMAAFEKIRPKETGVKRKLAPADRKFAAAVDAFARAFPADPEVVLVIYRNGLLFFETGDYDEAVKRFGLIVTQYPDDPNAGTAGDKILESLAKGEDYRNIEEWAKRLKGARAFRAPAEQQRLDEIIVQAIGKTAEKLLSGGRNEDAAAAYLRAAKEYPNDKRAPGSLLAAGTALEAAAQPLRAAETYLALVEKYPNDNSAGNAAFAAGRVYETMAYFDKAVDAYKRVGYRYANDPRAADALYNVVVLGQALGESKEAIRAAEAAQKRRDLKQHDIEELSFRIGTLWADTGEAAQAAQAFTAFLRRYSSSARVVEAETRAGRAYLTAGDAKRAEEELGRALALWRRLKKPQQRETARWAAEARYLQGESTFRAYQAIGLGVPPQALKAALDQKKALLAKAQTIYTDVVSYGDATWATAALYRIGQIYEQFAGELRKLPPPPGLRPEELQVYQEEVDRYVIDMEDKAAGIYQTGYKKALDLHVYGETTRQLRQGLGRLASGRFPPEREVRAGTRVGDRAPEPQIAKDIAKGNGGDRAKDSARHPLRQ